MHYSSPPTQQAAILTGGIQWRLDTVGTHAEFLHQMLFGMLQPGQVLVRRKPCHWQTAAKSQNPSKQATFKYCHTALTHHQKTNGDRACARDVAISPTHHRSSPCAVPNTRHWRMMEGGPIQKHTAYAYATTTTEQKILHCKQPAPAPPFVIRRSAAQRIKTRQDGDDDKRHQPNMCVENNVECGVKRHQGIIGTKGVHPTKLNVAMLTLRD